MEIILPEDHVLYASAQYVDQICRPLRETFGIKIFSYVKINPDYSRIHLENYPRWTEFFFKKVHSYYEDSGITECQHWSSGYALLETLAEKECIKDGREFDIGNGVVLADHSEGCTELAYFALSANASNSRLINLLNSIDLLQKFLIYFKSQAADILKMAAKTPIVLPFLQREEGIQHFSIDAMQRNHFLKTMNAGPFLAQYSPSQREFECLQYIQKGYTAKMIGKKLSISHRTVEHHLAHIREKVGVHSVKQLLEMF